MSGPGGHSSFRLASDRDYRRGVILGLTLAEILLLLVFLLLLAAGSLVSHAQQDAARQEAHMAELESRLRPVIDALAEAGTPVGDLDSLSALIRRGQDADALGRQAEAARSALAAAEAERAQTGQLLDQARSDLKAARLEASRAAPAAGKAAGYDRIVAALDALPGGAGARPEQTVINAIGQWREAVSRLGRIGGAGGRPVCWARGSGEPEPVLDFELRDDGYRVHDVAPRPRPDDPAWAAVAQVPHETLVELKDINAAVAGLIAEANHRQCRFAVVVHDATGATNKAQYKRLNYPLYQAFEVRETSR